MIINLSEPHNEGNKMKKSSIGLENKDYMIVKIKTVKELTKEFGVDTNNEFPYPVKWYAEQEALMPDDRIILIKRYRLKGSTNMNYTMDNEKHWVPKEVIKGFLTPKLD
jgi:hypothetical protein